MVFLVDKMRQLFTRTLTLICTLNSSGGIITLMLGLVRATKIKLFHGHRTIMRNEANALDINKREKNLYFLLMWLKIPALIVDSPFLLLQ